MSTPATSLSFLRALLGRPERPAGQEPERGAVDQVIADRWHFVGTLAPGRVSIGHDALLDLPARLVALDPSDAATLERARALLRPAHPALARAYTLHPHGDVVVLVLEALDGRTLAETPHVDGSRLAMIASSVLDGLAHAHAQGVLHGALDADSILLGADGRVVLDGFSLKPPLGSRVDDLTGLGAALVAAARPPGSPGEATPPVASALAALAAGQYSSADLAREAVSRARRMQAHVATEGRPVRPPPWASRTLPPAVLAAPAPLARPVPAAAAAPAPAPAPTPPPGMAWIPNDTGGFFLDRRAVTNRMWRSYLDATGATPPAHWLGRRVPSGRDEHPVVGVTLVEARAYARWRKARLPTLDEWRRAAGEPLGRPFPWGAESCSAERCVCGRHGGTDTAPVGTHPASATPEGVEDLLGNAWEWVEGGTENPGRALVIGGSFRHACKAPGHAPTTELSIDSSYLYVSVRCASDPESK